MHKIRRIHLHECGYPEGYFEGLTLDLSSKDDGRAVDHLIHAVNGLGKTTMLSLIFSLFEPERKKFLKTMIDGTAKFEDYFRRGRVGYVVLEFELQASQLSFAAPERLVVGQAVWLGAEGEDGDILRRFFAFGEASGLTFDALPLGGLNALSEPSLDTFELLKPWLSRNKQERADFFFVDDIKSWRQHLVSRGLDPHLMAIQKTFSLSEGGVGERWLDFESEADFLNLFFELVLPEERAEAIRKLVHNQVQKLGSLPDLLNQKEALSALSNHLAVFRETAEGWQKALSGRRQNEGNLGVLRANLLAAKHDAETRSARASQLVEGHARAADVHEMKANETRALGLLLKKVAEERHHEERRRHQQTIQNLLTAAEQREKALDAERELRDVESEENKHAILSEELKVANLDVAPIFERLQRAGRQWRDKLQAMQKTARKEAELARTRALMAAEQEKLHEQLLASARQDAELARRELSTHRRSLEMYHEQHDRLVRDGSLSSDEAPEVACQRLTAEGLEAEARQKRADSLYTALVMQAVQERGQAQEFQRLAQEARRESVQIEERIEAAKALRADIQSSNLLGRVADEHPPEPDRNDLPPRLTSLIENAERRLHGLLEKQHRLDADREFLEQHDLSRSGADNEAVIEHLQSHGVRAVAFEHYLAANVSEVETARALIASDPARYTGVAVFGSVDTIEALAKHVPPRLDRPVVVSQVDLEPRKVNMETPRVVYQPFSAARFNKQAASEEGERLRAELEEVAATIEIERRQVSEARQVLILLERYHDKHGTGCLAFYAAEQGRLAVLEGNHFKQSEALNRHATEIENDLAPAAKVTRDEAVRQQQATNRKHERIQEFLAREVSLKVTAERELPLWKAKLEAFITDEAKQTEAIRVQRDLANDAKGTEQTRERDADDLARAFDGVEHWHPKKAATDPKLHVEQLEAAYKTQLGLWQTEVGGRVQVIEVQMHACIESIKKSRESYREKSQELAAEYLSAFRKVVDLDAIARAEKGKLADLKTAIRDANQDESNANASAKSARDAYEANGLEVTLSAAHANESLSALREFSSMAKQRSNDFFEQMRKSKEAGETEAKSFSEANRDVSKLGNFLDRLSTLWPDVETLSATPSEPPIELEAFETLVANDIRSYRDMQKRVLTAETSLRDDYKRVVDFVREPGFQKVEPALSHALSIASEQDAGQDAERLYKLFEQRRDTVEDDLNNLEGDRDRCISALEHLVEEAGNLLYNAQRLSAIPKEVPDYGGEQVIHVKFRSRNVSPTDRKNAMSSLLRRFIEEGTVPERGHVLATQAIFQLAGGPRADLGIRLLKPHHHAYQKHVPINNISFSGGQRITAAILLYTVVQQLRIMALTNSRQTRPGGVLLLDNPLGPANKLEFVELQRHMADKMGLQLIFASPTEEFHLVDLFSTISRLVPDRVERRGGKPFTLVGNASFQKSTLGA